LRAGKYKTGAAPYPTVTKRNLLLQEKENGIQPLLFVILEERHEVFKKLIAVMKQAA
jgi:hypothetical protein